ncbi:LysM peptidoglycan-binding domain-containing protein [Macrococcus capreoli]|uniref:LysM peptidoglycan-binding domain-containing protein n=1 Tax=Macrococcus capreoli TaxID=2982690 RepID=UPI003EE61CAE
MKKKLIFAATTASAAMAAYSYQAEAAEHTVQPGESLWLIANKYNTTIDQLKSLNRLSSNLIFPYQTLKVSGTPTTVKKPASTNVYRKPVTTTTSATHTVQPGESVYSIATKYKMSMTQLMKLNNLSSYLIFPNQKLKISGTVTPVKTTTTNTSTNTQVSRAPQTTTISNVKTYVVRPGDYLAKIANQYGVTVQNIKTWNNLTSNVIYSNQRLIVSGGSTATVSTPVKTVNTTPAKVAVVPQTAQTPIFYHSNLYDYGQCTWYVFNRRASIGKNISTYWWHAYNWANGARNDGYTVDRTPTVGSIATTTDGPYGHVAFVERVNPDGTILVSETNYLTPAGVVGYRTLTYAQMSRYQFIH